MDLSPFIADTPATRHDGWTPERRIAFLDALSIKGTVAYACLKAGMSREAAYRLRRRDPLFARGWNGALALARTHGEEILARCALDGIEEEVWHRGEHVGTRYRFDTRLLLAHLARLDRLVEASPAGADMARFDEVLALIGGAQPDEELACDADGLPLARDAAMAQAADEVRSRVLYSDEELLGEDGVPVEDEDERRELLEEICEQAAEEAWRDAGRLWDEWFRRACAAVDGTAENAAEGTAETDRGTPCTLSTSGVEQAPSPTAGSGQARNPSYPLPRGERSNSIGSSPLAGEDSAA